MPEGDREGLKVDYAALLQDLQVRGLTVHHLERLPYREIPFYAAVYVSGRASDMDAYLREDFGRYVRRALPGRSEGQSE